MQKNSWDCSTAEQIKSAMPPVKKKRAASRHLEDKLHTDVATHLAKILPPHLGHFWFSIENRFLGARQGALNKARGVKAGIPDIQFIKKEGEDYRVFFVELKTKEGRLSDSQKKTFPLIMQTGIPIEICRSVQEVEDFLKINGFIG